MSVKEELTLLPQKKKIPGEDVYYTLKKYTEEKKIPIYKVVSMTTDAGICIKIVNSRKKFTEEKVSGPLRRKRI
ncbi:hypothetical protein TNCV_1376521 [Trichonephila clavipes]|nr:hypothetical protein TNCV_1376521 [Trichonephila clavipes]